MKIPMKNAIINVIIFCILTKLTKYYICICITICIIICICIGVFYKFDHQKFCYVGWKIILQKLIKTWWCYLKHYLNYLNHYMSFILYIYHRLIYFIIIVMLRSSFDVLVTLRDNLWRSLKDRPYCRHWRVLT